MVSAAALAGAIDSHKVDMPSVEDSADASISGSVAARISALEGNAQDVPPFGSVDMNVGAPSVGGDAGRTADASLDVPSTTANGVTGDVSLSAPAVGVDVAGGSLESAVGDLTAPGVSGGDVPAVGGAGVTVEVPGVTLGSGSMPAVSVEMPSVSGEVPGVSGEVSGVSAEMPAVSGSKMAAGLDAGADVAGVEIAPLDASAVIVDPSEVAAQSSSKKKGKFFGKMKIGRLLSAKRLVGGTSVNVIYSAMHCGWEWSGLNRSGGVCWLHYLA